MGKWLPGIPACERRLPIARELLMFCLLVPMPQVGFGQLIINGDFDHGSIDLANTVIEGGIVTLAGRDNFNSGSWKWLYFSVDQTSGIRPTFQIDDNFASGSSRLADHEMVYSYDQQTWHFFDNNDWNSSQGTFTFLNNSPFVQDTVYIAYGLPYSSQQVADHTAAIRNSAWVGPTLSGNSELVIGQSSGGTDDLGRNIPPHDLYGYVVTDQTFTAEKAKIVINGGIHANETLANHTIEGLADFVISDDVEAARLRRYAETYIYPMTNPDGRFAGYNRSTVEHVDRDPNRFWREDLYADMTDIQTVAEAMKLDTGGDVDYFIDVHSTVDTDQHHGFLDFDQNFHLDPFWQSFLALEPETGSVDASLINWTAQKFGLERLLADFTMTLETEFIPGENIDRFHAFGRNLGKALDAAHTILGDLDFDRDLDADDWLTFVAHAESDLAGLLPIEAYELGDLDGDGQNSISDFSIFKDTFELQNGVGSFAQMLADVPEPSTSLLLIFGLGMMLGRLRNQQHA